jgi:hypothetical protein
MAHGFTPAFGVDLHNVYLNKHSFNNPKFNCFVAKYTTARIYINLAMAAGQVSQVV